jgi:hypothetical protein
MDAVIGSGHRRCSNSLKNQITARHEGVRIDSSATRYWSGLPPGRVQPVELSPEPTGELAPSSNTEVEGDQTWGSGETSEWKKYAIAVTPRRGSID